MQAFTLYLKTIERLTNLYDAAEAKNIATILFEKMLGKKLNSANFVDENLDENLAAEIEKAVDGLLHHKPIQQIVNEAWFYKYPFFVDENVLIPRPETEELVWELLRFAKPLVAPKILDIGSGSGCIPISIKLNKQDAEITSIDVSKNALKVALVNAEKLDAQVNFIEQDFLEESNWKALPKCDAIISNPPYIARHEACTMHKNVLENEPAIALFVSDDDPLVFYKKIARFGKKNLLPNGKIFVEINERLGPETQAVFELEGYQSELKKDMQGKHRMVLATLCR